MRQQRAETKESKEREEKRDGLHRCIAGRMGQDSPAGAQRGRAAVGSALRSVRLSVGAVPSVLPAWCRRLSEGHFGRDSTGTNE